MSDPNWRANWLEKWGYIPPLVTQPDPQLLAQKEAQKLAEKEARERVEKALHTHVGHLPENIKQQVKEIVAEAQARIGLAPDSPKLTLIPRKSAISHLKRFVLKKS